MDSSVCIDMYGNTFHSLTHFYLELFALILWNVFFCFVSVILWHFTAVSCSLCSIIEDEEEEADYPNVAYRNGAQHDRKSERLEPKWLQIVKELATQIGFINFEV